MSVDSALDDLLDQWEDARARGVTLTPEQLCVERPDMLEQVRAKIDVLRSMDQRMKSDPDVTKVHSSTRGGSRVSNDQAGIPLERPQLQNGFDGLRFHAQGGLGMVFEGTDFRLHRRVVLKFMHKHMAEVAWARERFLLEAEITGRLDHPGIVPVHGVGFTETGRPFYAMRFIRGETLEDAIAMFHKGEPRSSEEKFDHDRELRGLVTRLISICNTLAYAHNCGIVHRDIKPENIMLGRYAETLVVDWGLAFSVDRDEMAKRSGEATLMPMAGSQAGGSTGGPAGTPAYMSPEQAFDCDNVDRRADVYSLGTMLYKILCGKVPYKGTPMQILDQLKKGRFAAPSEVLKNVPPQLEAICLKAMTYEPDDRYQTALDMAADLERWQADEPIAVYKESRSMRWGRWLRRRRGLVLGVMLGLTMLSLAGLIASVSFGTLAQAESSLRASAEVARHDAEEARKQTLKLATSLAAETVGLEINRRWELLEYAQQDSDLIGLLNTLNTDPQNEQASSALHGWLERLGKRLNDSQTEYETLFIVDAQGIQLAKEPPDSDTLGRNYAKRDYFHGLGRNLGDSDPDPTQPIKRPHLSTVYVSTSGKKELKVAFSVPIWTGKPGTPNRKIVGVLGMSVELNNLGDVLAPKMPGNQQPILVDLRFDELADKKRQRGLILHHPIIAKSETQSIQHVPAAMTQRLLDQGAAALWEAQQRDRGALQGVPKSADRPIPKEGINRSIPDYVDPVDPAQKNWLAAYSTVWIPHRADKGEIGPDRSLDTGWVVVVQEKLDSAEKK
ncbi:MAG: serine/threonine protein kinase [Pirellulales bacterium]